MIPIRLIFVICFFFIAACSSLNSEKKASKDGKNNMNTTALAPKIDQNDTLKPSKKEVTFNKTANIRILSMYKQYDPKSSSADSTSSTMKDYDNWVLNKKNILNILKSSKPISGTEWDFNYIVLPFWYKGELIINGIKGNYELNAGSFIIFEFNDTTIYLGCSLKSMRKFF